jgi:uncharacterized integral membrane protein (TIGR00697 family)
MLADSQETPHKCLIFLSMVYISILFSSAVIANKVISAPFVGSFSAASITGPFWFLLSDIIAEVYGWRTSLRMFRSAMICEFIFLCISSFLTHLPSPNWWHNQESYNYVMGYLFPIYFSQLVGIIIAWYLNIRFLTRWQISLRGRYFWLRTIGASGIGEIIYSIIAVTLNTIGTVPAEQLPKIVGWSCLLKIICTIAFAYPATLIVAILRHIEKIKPPNYDFNPFDKPLHSDSVIYTQEIKNEA